MHHSNLCDTFYPSFGADLIIALIGAVLGLGGAYFIYLFSIWQVRNDRLKYVVSLIKKIAPSAIRQGVYCKEHAERIISNPFSNENLKLEANRDPKRLADKVDQEGVYHAFLWKYKRTQETYKLFQELYGLIDYIDYLVDDLIDTNERILNSRWGRKKNYQLTFKKARDTIQSFTLIQELTETQPDLVKYAVSLLEQFTRSQPTGENIAESYKIVVEPLQSYITIKASRHTKVTELMFLLQDLSNEYHGIELSSKHNAEDYKYYADKLETTANKLIDCSKNLRIDFV